MQFHHHTLENGLEIVAEVNPRAQSAAVGFFVRTGARDESPELSGVSHFLEHMAFKGNERFTADDVNRIFDEVGAKYNASTSEEITLYYAAILPEYLPRTFELLANLLRPSLREGDFRLEQQVILEEIGMYEDAPGFLVYDHAMQTHFEGHPLGRRILGTAESVSALTPESMRGYYQSRYRAGNIVLAAAGRIAWDDIVRLARAQCGDWPAGSPPRVVTAARPPGRSRFVHRPAHHQQHVMQLAPAPAAGESLRFAAELLSMIVGDEAGSRLYWLLTDPGLAETAELTYNEYEGEGCWCTYLSCDPEMTRENLSRIGALYDDINRRGVTESEVTQARNKLATRIVLAGERPMGRLSTLGGNWMYRREYRSIAEDLECVRGLTAADITALLRRYPLAQTTTVGVGPLTGVSTENPV